MVSSQLSLVKDIFALGQISRGTAEVHVCVAEVLSVCASLVIWRAGAQRHFRFSHIHGTLISIHGSELWQLFGSPRKKVCYRGRKQAHATGTEDRRREPTIPCAGLWAMPV